MLSFTVNVKRVEWVAKTANSVRRQIIKEYKNTMGHIKDCKKEEEKSMSKTDSVLKCK